MGGQKRRAQLSEALNDIDMRIHSNLGSHEIMQAALDGFVDALAADAGDIKLHDEAGWVVSFEHGFGPEAVGQRLSADEAPVAARVAELREPVAIHDYRAEPAVPFVGFPVRYGLRSVLAMPLIIRDEVAGCLFAWMRDVPRTFSPTEIDFAMRMAASVALALENARLLESEQLARQRAEQAERLLGEELERTTVLLKASDELTSTTDLDELLERLARVVLEATGITRAFINLVDTEARTLTPKVATGGLSAPHGETIPLDRLSETSKDAFARGETAFLDYEVPCLPEGDRRIAESNGARLVLFIPLIHQGRLIGHISLDQPNERYDFTPEQVRVVESIAAQASVAVNNAQLFAREHRIAEVLQQAILASPEPVDGLEVACLYQPASTVSAVGGDYYDVLDLGSGQVALLIGDVSGKGIEAARLTALIRDGVRAYLQEETDPVRVVSKLSALVHRFTPADKFTTAFLGILDRERGTLEYSGGGQPCPVVVGTDGTRMLETAPGLLGAFADASFGSYSATLALDDVLVLVTDGVTEARLGADLLGEVGLAEILDCLRGTPVADLPQALLASVLERSGGQLRDDVAILCVRRAPSALDAS